MICNIIRESRRRFPAVSGIAFWRNTQPEGPESGTALDLAQRVGPVSVAQRPQAGRERRSTGTRALTAICLRQCPERFLLAFLLVGGFQRHDRFRRIVADIGVAIRPEGRSICRRKHRRHWSGSPRRRCCHSRRPDRRRRRLARRRQQSHRLAGVGRTERHNDKRSRDRDPFSTGQSPCSCGSTNVAVG